MLLGDLKEREEGLPLGRPSISSQTWYLDYSILPNIKRPWRIATAFIITATWVLSRDMITRFGVLSWCSIRDLERQRVGP